MKTYFYAMIVFAAAFAAHSFMSIGNGTVWAVGAGACLVCLLGAREIKAAASREGVALNGYMTSIHTATIAAALLRKSLDGEISKADIDVSVETNSKDTGAGRSSMSFNIGLMPRSEAGRAAIVGVVKGHGLDKTQIMKVGEYQPPPKVSVSR